MGCCRILLYDFIETLKLVKTKIAVLGKLWRITTNTRKYPQVSGLQ